MFSSQPPRESSENIQAYLFDLDGTLINSTPDISNAINKVRALYNLSALSPQEIERGVGRGSGHLLQVCFPVELHKHMHEIRAQFIKLYEANLYVDSYVFPEVIECLDRLKLNGTPLALVTNKPIKLTRSILEQLGWLDRFHYVCGGDSFSQRKPHPMPILETLKQLKMRPEEVLFIGDTEVDVEAAQRAGVPLMIVPYGRAARDILSGKVDSPACVSPLSELPFI